MLVYTKLEYSKPFAFQKFVSAHRSTHSGCVSDNHIHFLCALTAMSSVAERTVKIGESSLELDISYDLGGEEDTDFYEEPPCLCAQQIISSLFGTILGYLAVLLTPAQIYFPVAIAQVKHFNCVNFPCRILISCKSTMY